MSTIVYQIIEEPGYDEQHVATFATRELAEAYLAAHQMYQARGYEPEREIREDEVCDALPQFIYSKTAHISPDSSDVYHEHVSTHPVWPDHKVPEHLMRLADVHWFPKTKWGDVESYSVRGVDHELVTQVASRILDHLDMVAVDA